MFPDRRQRNQLATSINARLRRLQPWNFPTHIFLEVTNRCNLSCIMCGRTHDRRHQDESFIGDMPLATVRQLDELYGSSSFVTATGLGEPFLNPEFLPIVRHLKSRGATVSFTSNGTLLNKEAAREVVESGVDRVVFSIDSPISKTFEQIRVGARLEVILKNLERLVQFREQSPSKTPYLILEFVAMAKNFHHLPLLADLANRLRFDEVIVQNLFKHFAPGYDVFYQKNKLAVLQAEEAFSIWHDFEQRLEEYGIKLYSPFEAEGVRDYLSEEGSLKAPQLKSRDGFLGYVDSPRPMERLTRECRVRGWALAKTGFPRTEISLESSTSSLQKVATATISRPDVLPHLPAEYPQEPLCGFDERLDLRGLESGVYTLTMKVCQAKDSRVHVLARQRVLIETKNLHRMYCTQPWSTVYVTWDGTVRTCCFNEFPLGDLAESSLFEIWRGKTYRTLRRRVRQGDILEQCADCLAGKSTPDYIRPLRSYLRIPGLQKGRGSR